MFVAASAWCEVADGWGPSWAERGDMRTPPSVHRVVETDEGVCACAYWRSVPEDTREREGIVEVNMLEACVHSFRSYGEGSPYTAESACWEARRCR